jgi:hypothetical protein
MSDCSLRPYPTYVRATLAGVAGILMRITPRALAVHAMPWAGALLVVALAIQRTASYYPPGLDAASNSDAYFTYLPNARKWLAQGWNFLLHDPHSADVAPLGYLWPALWRADTLTTVWANCGLFVLSALMMAQAARRLGGWLGATVAVLMLIYHPDISLNMCKVLTESLYLFGLMLLSWSLIEILLGRELARTRWFILGGIGLTITLLSRPVLQFTVLGGLALTLSALFMPRLQAWRSCLRRLFIMLVASCVLPLAVVVKNGIQFDLWSIASGSGTGLYYGVNPLRMGHEPVFMGFEYEIALVVARAEIATRGDPLDRTANRIGHAAAISVLQHTHSLDLLRFFGYKFRSWLLYSTPELQFNKNLRRFRLVEWLCIAAAAMTWLIRRRAAREPDSPLERRRLLILALLGLGVAIMLAQLLPFLYNTRYNAVFLEPWLLLLTGAATGSLLSAWQVSHGWGWRSPRWRQAALLLALAALAVALTNWTARHETLPIDPERLGPVTPVLGVSGIGPATADAPSIGPQRWRLQDRPATLEIPLHQDNAAPYPAMDFLDGVWRIHLRVAAAQPARCRSAYLKIEYPPDERVWPKPILPIIADGRWRTYAISGNHNLRPMRPGRMWIVLNCAPGTEIEWGSAELLRSEMPDATRALWLSGEGIDPYTPLRWVDQVKPSPQ